MSYIIVKAIAIYSIAQTSGLGFILDIFLIFYFKYKESLSPVNTTCFSIPIAATSFWKSTAHLLK